MRQSTSIASPFGAEAEAGVWGAQARMLHVIAESKGWTLEQAAAQTSSNARAFLRS